MHTLICSDLHLSEVPAVDPLRPLWRAFMRREHLPDDDHCALLDRFTAEVAARGGGPAELILNGDSFDFDNILSVPDDRRVDWLARQRGLGSEEWMSLYKIDRIVADHRPWFDRLRAFVRQGHRIVFVVGNHDLELLWPSVQDRLRAALGLTPRARTLPGGLLSEAPPPDDGDPVVFSNWFYVSGQDTLVTHGHQYDPNCAVPDMIDPVITAGGRPRIRIPFGDLAERYMLNGMGYFNPHATENYIMSGRQYVRFFMRYMLRTQPLLAWTWFWSALVTLYISLRSHWKPVERDPLLVEEKLQNVAARARATPAMVRRLRALDVPPAASNPLRVVRELWLDRAVLLIALLYLSWMFVLQINWVLPVSTAWIVVPLALALPPFIAYAIDVRPTVFAEPLLTPDRARVITTITGLRRIVMGHTHVPVHEQVGDVEYLNTGFWSAAFADPDCSTRIGAQTYVWIRPREDGPGRVAELLTWSGTPAVATGPVPGAILRAPDPAAAGADAGDADEHLAVEHGPGDGAGGPRRP